MILIFLNVGVYALDTQSTLNIYHEIFSSLLGSQKMKVYTRDKELRQVFKHSKKIVLSDTLANSTIILVSSQSDLRRYKKEHIEKLNHIIMFATDYRLLKKYDNIVGAFYWKKGRSQLLFIKHRLDKYHIKLAPKYRAFIVDEL